MLRCSPMRQNVVNRAAARMVPVTRRPLQHARSPLHANADVAQRGAPSGPTALPKVLPPHLIEKNNRVSFLRTLGLGRRRAEKLAKRTYISREADEEVRTMMRMPLYQPDLNAARLKKIEQLTSPASSFPKNAVNRADGRMGPANKGPLPRGRSPLPPLSLQVLPPHLIEKNNRIDFLRKLGFGRRRADQLTRRSFYSREADQLIHDMMHKPLDQPELNAAQLRKILQLLDPMARIPFPLGVASPIPQPPSPPRNINWIESPKHYSTPLNANYGNDLHLDRRPNDPRQFQEYPERSMFDDLPNTSRFSDSPNERSSAFIDEPPININRRENPNMDYRNYRQLYANDNETFNFESDWNNDRYDRGRLDVNHPPKAYNEPILTQQSQNKPMLPANKRKRKLPDNSNIRSGPVKRKALETVEAKDIGLFSKRSRQRGFHVGGFRLPYTDTTLKVLPQPETKSHAVRFFKKSPNYMIGSCSPESVNFYDSDEIYDDDSIAGKGLLAETLFLEWSNIYRSKNYRNWHNWWKDFQWCEIGIDKQLERFNGYNVKYTFILNLIQLQDQDEGSYIENTTKKLLNSANLALVKNLNGYNYNMRTIFQLMSEAFLENLSLSDIEQLLDIIRSVPNHLWIYKMRSMIFMWSKYWEVNTGTSNINREASIDTAKEWNSPVFHWLAKQAYNELKILSKIEWGGHKDFFGD
ncbi:uncharacterized protein [Drosophila tropicalis]|uniref:uncharacterized protein isoform X2 n=1 Tax=Drosophila tropicalis TaxID=46794 RepID=UPI0035AC29AA